MHVCISNESDCMYLHVSQHDMNIHETLRCMYIFGKIKTKASLMFAQVNLFVLIYMFFQDLLFSIFQHFVLQLGGISGSGAEQKYSLALN